MYLNEGTALNISPCLLCDLHDELIVVGDALSQDVEVNSCAHVVNVGHETDLPSFTDHLIKDPGVVKGLVEVTVTGWVVTKLKQDRLQTRNFVKMYCLKKNENLIFKY